MLLILHDISNRKIIQNTVFNLLGFGQKHTCHIECFNLEFYRYYYSYQRLWALYTVVVLLPISTLHILGSAWWSWEWVQIFESYWFMVFRTIRGHNSMCSQDFLELNWAWHGFRYCLNLSKWAIRIKISYFTIMRETKYVQFSYHSVHLSKFHTSVLVIFAGKSKIYDSKKL